MVRVSAIISTYNSERFLVGRLEDLLAQTLYAKGELEIILVNAGSKQGERYIARQFLGCITYIESLREGIYSSWNRGIAIAKGTYLTNSNTDDRLRPDALEVMANTLDANPDIGLVYGDAVVVSSENAVWGKPYTVSTKPPYYGRLAWPDFDPKLMTKFCSVGPQPMWRRSIHTRLGLFDDSWQLAGDYEMWLRMVAHGETFKHIPEVLGLFFDDGAGINNPEHSAMETRRAVLRWGGMIK